MEDEKALTKAEIAVAEAFTKADSEDATPEDGKQLRALLRKHPGALGFGVDTAGAAIDQVVICYLRMNMTEQAYDNGMAGGCSFDAGSYWERKLSTVQRRYLRSIETLARVRKLMGVPMVQINIAAEGRQQVVSNTSFTDTAPSWRAG